jgi:hypothetical protein
MKSLHDSSSLKYGLHILEHDPDYYKYSKVKIIHNAKKQREVPVKALINIILMAIVSIVAFMVIVASVAKAI